MTNKVVIVIMAGGLGKRMNSNIPKVIHNVAGIPMINHILSNVNLLNDMFVIEKILVVVGKYKREIKEAIEEYIHIPNLLYIDQPEPLGTGNAIQCCRDELMKYSDTNTLILSGDVPMLSSLTMFNTLNKLKIARIIVTKLLNPSGYGRIIEKNGKFLKIVEQKDATKEELKINKVNCGIYAINTTVLCKYLPFLNNNNSQNEYYLTDIIEIIKRSENIDIDIFEIEESKQIEILGVNTIDQLKELDLLIYDKQK